ncbi:MAG: hypothetical protein IJY31_06540 [Muribaculaceae bacterium]|nr:hypothetical protein [Muribaculaceae bacterium]
MDSGITITIVADIVFLWESDENGDITEIKRIFRYHLSDCIPQSSITHSIEIRTCGSSIKIPDDKKVKWSGYYMGLATGDNTMEWYNSSSTGLDYIVLSQGCIIVHDRKKSHTICYARATEKSHANSGKPRIEVENTLVVLIHTIASMYNRYTVHAAAVRHNGYAHVFMGRSGRGKTTLCTDCLRQGAEFMGDDLVFFYMENGKIMIGSLLLDIKLAIDGSTHKRHIDIIKELNAGYTLSAPAKSISLIKQIIPHDGQKSYLEQQEPIDAIVHLFRASNSPLMQYNPEQWQNVFQTAAETLPYNILHFGDRNLLDIKILDGIR